jgi:hypothetical protein
MTLSRIPFLVVAGLLLAQGAVAATAKPPVAGTYATREQLRECLGLDDGLKSRLHAMETATVAHNQKFDANQAEGVKLVELKAKLDRGDKAAVQAFNQTVQEHNVHLQQVDEEAVAADVATQSLNADQAAVDQKCGPLTYRPADMDAVVKERRKAAVTATAASAP